MPALANPKWERFAWCIVEGLGKEHSSQGRAYQAAGYKAKDAGKQGGSAEAAASRLLNKVQPILARVNEIQTELAKRKKVTIQTIADELDEARQIAAQEKQSSAMVAASSTKAKLYGLFVDKQEIGKPNDFSEATSTREIIEREFKGLGAGNVSPDMVNAGMALLAAYHEGMQAIIEASQADASASAN